MEPKEQHTGMRMFVNADVTHLIAILIQITVVLKMLMQIFAGDLMAQRANACNFTKIACQDTTGTRLMELASATQRLAQMVTTGMEPGVLANAIQNLVFPVLTGRNHGANAETYH